MVKKRIHYSILYGLIAVLLVSLLTGCFGDKQAQQSVPAADKRDCVAANGVVTSAHPIASQAGLEVLKQGGNAIDAAIATALTLGVVEPYASGLGGGGMAIVYIAKENKSYIVDFQDVGPLKCRPDTYKRINGKIPEFKKIGYKSVAVPGELRGLELLHQKFGSKQWSSLFTAAIKTAEQGFEVTKTLNGIITEDMMRIEKYPTGSQKWFQKQFYKDGLPLQPKEKYYNKELAATLKKIASGGADVFYKGEIAEAIAKEFAKPEAEGWITKQDLANYKAVLREPLRGIYRDYEIFSFPPAGSGMVVLEMLNIMEGFDLAKMGRGADFQHVFIETQKLAFADRSEHGGDTDFVKVPIDRLLDKKYAEQQRKRIDLKKAFAGRREAGFEAESGSTTSFAVIDKEGNMVSITKTLGHFMGSGVAVPGTGFILNDHMDTFYANPKSRNAPAPGKRVFSSISSSLVTKDGKPVMAVGSPGASRIISTVAEIIINVIDFKMDLQQAINADRVHNRNEKVTSIEGSVTPEIIKKLEERGHKINKLKKLDLYFGGAQGVMLRSDGKIQGAADPRRDGIAVGY